MLLASVGNYLCSLTSNTILYTSYYVVLFSSLSLFLVFFHFPSFVLVFFPFLSLSFSFFFFIFLLLVLFFKEESSLYCLYSHDVITVVYQISRIRYYVNVAKKIHTHILGYTCICICIYSKHNYFSLFFLFPFPFLFTCHRFNEPSNTSSSFNHVINLIKVSPLDKSLSLILH